MLDFIEGHLRAEARNKAVGIAPGSRQNAGIVESEILALLAGDLRRLHQGTFSGLAGSVDQDSRCIGKGFKQGTGQVTVKHVLIINHCVDDYQPKSG
jgi:hypothetical protein